MFIRFQVTVRVCDSGYSYSIFGTEIKNPPFFWAEWIGYVYVYVIQKHWLLAS
jgi:hypothetical protein